MKNIISFFGNTGKHYYIGLLLILVVFFFSFNSTYVPVPRKIKVKKEKVRNAVFLIYSANLFVGLLSLQETARIQGSP